MNDPLKWVLAIVIGVLFIRNFHEIEARLLVWLTVPPTEQTQKYVDIHKGGRR